MNKKNPEIIKRFDIFFIAILLFISLMAVLLKSDNLQGDKAYIIRVVGAPELTKVFHKPLDKPIKIKGLKGISVIEWNPAGKVRIASSPCPMHLCINTGWIGANNSVVCIPNGIIVECIASSGLQLDGVSR